MKKSIFRHIIDVFLFGLACTMITLTMILWAGGAVYAAVEDWPREIVVPEGEIVIYQPQLETFKGDKLTARSAVAVTPKGIPEPIFGAVWFDARVSTNRDTRTVTALEVKVSNSRFPNATPENLEKLKSIIDNEIPKWGELSVSLDRLLTMLDMVEKKKIASENLNTDPPRIVFVTHPAVLVSLDGDPELRKVENSDLMRVVNTPVFMVLEPSTKVYYLKGGNDWFQASDVMGPWKDAPSPPASVVDAAQGDWDAGAHEGTDSQTSVKRKLQIMVTTVPTELVVSDGEPKYTPIKDTDLSYMSNTDSDVFLENDPRRYFILVSGRWFTSPSLDGPWSYAGSDKLPAGFAKIPPESEIGHVLASVAGTVQAKEAVLDANIPQTAAIKRDSTITVTYDGEPKFKNIKETEMYYAVNTGYSVIRVGNLYYCCHEAVWYVASDPLGPWAVCVSVPRVIYTIPPDYPVYNVKYVYVYDSTPDVVYIGYTPGYMGTYVYTGTVVYGTGYYYPGWYGRRYYYYRPVTYGYAVVYRPYYGWGVATGFAAGVWAGHRWGGWYGGWRSGDVDIDINRNINVNRNNIYNRQENISRNIGGRDRPGAGAGRDKVGSGTGQKRDNNVFADREGNIHRKTDEGWQARDKGNWSDRDVTAHPSWDKSRASQARQRGTYRTNSYRQRYGSDYSRRRIRRPEAVRHRRIR